MASAAKTEDRSNIAPEDVGLDSRRLHIVADTIHKFVDEGRIAGAITMVSRKGHLALHDVYGKRDLENDVDMTEDTIFRIYSMTKPIASVALMQLYEKGLFQLDDPVSKYIPEMAELEVFVSGTAESYKTRPPEREMIVKDVLMHTSGLISGGGPSVVSKLYQEAKLMGSRSGGTLKDMVAKLGKIPLYCDPGSEWNYGISTDIVAYLTEVISGQQYDEYLVEHIFEPLGMTDTGFHVPPEKMDRFAANYRRNFEGEEHLTLVDAPGDESTYAKPKTYFSGAGGLVSTANDYLRFCHMLVGDGELDGVRIIGQRTLDYMTTNHLPNNGDMASMGQATFTETSVAGIGFGLGFAVLMDPETANIIGSPGEYYWGGAASTAFFISPDDELAMIFLTQLMPSGTYPFRRQLRQTIYQCLID